MDDPQQLTISPVLVNQASASLAVQLFGEVAEPDDVHQRDPPPALRHPPAFRIALEAARQNGAAAPDGDHGRFENLQDCPVRKMDSKRLERHLVQAIEKVLVAHGGLAYMGDGKFFKQAVIVSQSVRGRLGDRVGRAFR